MKGSGPKNKTNWLSVTLHAGSFCDLFGLVTVLPKHCDSHGDSEIGIQIKFMVVLEGCSTLSMLSHFFLEEV